MKNNISAGGILKFLCIVLGTAVSGLIVAIGVGYFVARILSNRMDFGGLVGLGVGVALGYPLGVFLGQVIVKGGLHFRGSLLLGLGGIVITDLLVFVIPSQTRFASPGLTQAYLVLAPVVGTVGYFLGRRKKQA